MLSAAFCGAAHGTFNAATAFVPWRTMNSTQRA